MKKLPKLFLIATGSIISLFILVLGSILLYVGMTDLPKFPTHKLDLTVTLTPQRVSRGKNIVTMVCAQCHMDPITHRLTGAGIFRHALQ